MILTHKTTKATTERPDSVPFFYHRPRVDWPGIHIEFPTLIS